MAGALILLIIVGVLFIWGALIYHGVIPKRKPKPKTPLDYPIDRKLWRKAEENAKIAKQLGIENCTTEFLYTDLWNKLHNKK